ncbi:uncharacterized protein [Apostichopus japonicus]|uniref:uncharacterized protein isoform X2 n=1 Tax=Stichopus japonicus TaxID=307972 RepID=UPI003AB3DB51
MDRLSIATVVILGLVLATSLSRGGAESISCDSVYFAELGKPNIIACNVIGDQYYVYWFRGEDTRTFPILSFDDEGEKSPHKEYSFTDNKSLNITNTELKHEGKYTLIVYFNEFDFDTTTTELQVYIRPDPPCPLIDACGTTCTGCQLNVTTFGSLTCYVSGSRPMMDVDWIVTNQSGVSFTKEEQTHKEMDDRWYTEKTIEYTTHGCGANATFRCIASLSDFPLAPLLNSHYSTVRIDKEACKEPPSMEPTSSPKGQVAWPFVVIGIIIVLVVICAIFIAFCLYRRRDTTKDTTPDQNTELQTKHTKPKPKTKSLEERKNTLVEGLMKYYEKFCYIKPLPWGEPIPIHALYTTCQCTITSVNGDVSHHASDFLSTPEFHFDNNRVFIIADLGYGKTTYTQNLVSDWVSKMKTPKKDRKDKISEPILIYVHLKEVDPSMILSELVEKMMPFGIDLMVDDIVEIFLNFEFQVLLDGLDELSMSTISTDTSAENHTNDKEERGNLLQDEGENDANLTVENLLDNKINKKKFKRIKVWVTSREVDDMQASFAVPYSKVKLNGFSNSQVNEYIHKTCKYYFKSRAIPQLPLILKSNRKDSKLDATQKAKSNAHNQEMIEIKTTNSDSRPVTEGGCNKAESIKYGNPLNREKNDENINEVTKEMKQNTEEKEQDTAKCSQTVDVEQLQKGEIKDEQIESNKSFTEDANNEANEGNMAADEVSDEVTTKLIPNDHHEIKQGESEQKDNTVPRNDMQAPVACDTSEILSKKVTECMELNEISHNFSETPLLLIMIVHIITCRMLDPTGKYKEVNVNKLTTIIRLVITCLESRYVQKVNNLSIQEDIKSLEDSLGKIAFENKMSLSLGKREYWNDKLGEEETQLALAIGLLKYSKKVGSGGSHLEELAFSSYAGIMFYHEFFQEFLAAQYVPESDEEWAWIDEFIKKSTDDATVRLLQFMFGMNHARLDKAVKSLVKEQKMWNNLIKCIYEISNLKKKQAIINGMNNEARKLGGKMIINIKHLDRKHHRVAFTDFCDACNASDVKLRKMTLREECAIDFIKDVTLPSLKFLIFLEMNVNEDQFVSIITSLTGRKCPEILQFVKCSVPMDLKEKAKQTVESALKGLDMRIYDCEKTSNATVRVPKFNPKKGNWENELFPERM